MVNNNENRESYRYQISEYVKDDFYKDIHIEININDAVYSANVLDVSMNGIGFELVSKDISTLKELDKHSHFFIKLYIYEKVIFTEAKKIWNAIVKVRENMVLKGGLGFSVISPEDRLNLAKFLENVRNRA